ncbi:stromal membrane-associated protein 1 isoform X2 [Acanthochromis polyacanthus]|uniref:stromal membrane-associated protein 1 isoform X2 n=1 Tax=Acanthochromis polyacanthus TaxID=80966 RepID=UPI0022341D7B|nr:stromal membrane-associated protein 1 isoform X2 [Acanthochromis polyacanthus]
MTTRSEREKAQKLNEQHQAILTKLLREEDNKYCADCEAKGPRWASWNLGVFMCIRCAGIHRNLGVHISRVKSVNLDQWTPEQIQSMVDMGNTRARQLYEAHLPESFRRPQTDQAVEVFIRDKYERKKYYDKEAAATAPLKSCEAAPSSSSPSSQADRTRHEKEREKKKEEKKKEKDSDKVDRHNNTKQSECRASPKKSTEPAVDLLGLDAPEGGGKSSGGAVPISDEMDIFGPMVSNPLPSSHNAQQAQSRSSTAPAQVDPSTSSSVSSSTSTTTTTKAEEKKLLSKDSILSLYASSSVGSQPQSQQQPAPGQGMYMGQPQMPFTPQGFAPAMAGGIPPTTMMGGGAMMSGMALPNGGYVGMQQGVLPANQGQNMYNMQQGQQQGQWNMSQMTQQMSGMALSGGGPTPGTLNQSGAPSAGWPAAPPPASGQTLSTQLWK